MEIYLVLFYLDFWGCLILNGIHDHISSCGSHEFQIRNCTSNHNSYLSVRKSKTSCKLAPTTQALFTLGRRFTCFRVCLAVRINFRAARRCFLRHLERQEEIASPNLRWMVLDIWGYLFLIAVEYQNMVQTKTIRNDVPQLGFDSLSGATKLGFMPKMCGSGFIHQPNEQIIWL